MNRDQLQSVGEKLVEARGLTEQYPSIGKETKEHLIEILGRIWEGTAKELVVFVAGLNAPADDVPVVVPVGDDVRAMHVNEDCLPTSALVEALGKMTVSNVPVRPPLHAPIYRDDGDFDDKAMAYQMQDQEEFIRMGVSAMRELNPDVGVVELISAFIPFGFALTEETLADVLGDE